MRTDPIPTAAVVGAGPAGLMAAEVLAAGGVAVTVYDHMASPGRKLLMAGRGGLNLTHGEDLSTFLSRYGAVDARLGEAVAQLPPETLRRWCADLGQDTFVGSSGRVFPVAMKASPMLRAWLRRLGQSGVVLALRHRWTGWAADGALAFDTPGGPVAVEPDATVLALGGGSWPNLGSDGAWTRTLRDAGIAITPLAPANGGVTVGWSTVFQDRFAGEPLKNVGLRFGDHASRGDVVVTRSGLEGGAVYALSRPIREALAGAGPVALHVALRPDLSVEDLAARLGRRKPKESLATALRRTLHLAPVAVSLLHEVTLGTDGPAGTLPPETLAGLINAVPVRIAGLAPLARVISTAGGLSWCELDPDFMLRRRPGVFAAGEMLDWEAPTGGYLLQAAFATGAAGGRGALAFIARTRGFANFPNGRGVDLTKATETGMRDYTLAIGDHDPYGFSAPDDLAALRHASDYSATTATDSSTRLVLSGPGGILTDPSETVAAFCARTPLHRPENTDDVRPADPTPPDCNVA